MRYLFFVFTFLLFQGDSFSQASEESGLPADTGTIFHFIKKGEFHLQANSYFIATDNAPQLNDYYAWAAGAGLSYVTPKWKGFQLGASGSFMYNILSSDLSAPDPLTQTSSRYEILMLDILNPASHEVLPRMEQLFIKYTLHNTSLQFGKMIINSPFLNRQEGRMPPNVEEGIWLKTEELKNIKIEGGWIWSITPRGTANWFPMAGSVGIYPAGVNPDGSKSAYKGNTKSNGVGIFNLTWLTKNFSIAAWNNYFENVMNSSLLQMEGLTVIKNRHRISWGLMFLRQDAVNKGGNEQISRAYVLPGNAANAGSAKITYGLNNWNITVAYTHITGSGRYLNPREWAFDPFYTFMQRELNEGLGKVNAGTLKLEYLHPNKTFRSSLTYGRYYLPDVKNTALNKYGMPSYQQLNLDFRISPGGTLKGCSLIFLIVYKNKFDDTYNNYKYLVNKVNLVNYNLVLDFSF